MNNPVRKSMNMADGAVSYLEWQVNAPRLHFAHANGFNAETYRTLVHPLAERFHIFASDARGHGFTTLPTMPGLAKGWRIFRDDLSKLLERLGAPMILAGHSMGATASVMTAAMHPSLVRGLILVEPVFVPAWQWRVAHFMRRVGLKNKVPDLATRAEKRRAIFDSFETAESAYRGRGAFKSWPHEIVQDYLKGGLLPANGQMRLACVPAWEAECFRETPLNIPRLGRFIKCPVTIIHGEGGTCRDEEAAIFARAHGKTRVVKIAGASHFLPMEHPGIVREEIIRQNCG
jgi:pimeloyl-ACP methyl ester carboxylesterase